MHVYLLLFPCLEYRDLVSVCACECVFVCSFDLSVRLWVLLSVDFCIYSVIYFVYVCQLFVGVMFDEVCHVCVGVICCSYRGCLHSGWVIDVCERCGSGTGSELGPLFFVGFLLFPKVGSWDFLHVYVCVCLCVL